MRLRPYEEEGNSELEAEVKRLLAQAEATDAAEEALYGKGKRGGYEPAEGWEFGKARLEKIRADDGRIGSRGRG